MPVLFHNSFANSVFTIIVQ